MADFFDTFDGAAGPLAGRVNAGKTWAKLGSEAGTPPNWQVSGSGTITMAAGATGTAKMPVTDIKTSLIIPTPPTAGYVRIGPSTDVNWTYQAYSGCPMRIQFHATAPYIEVSGTYATSPKGMLPVAGPWDIRLEANYGTFQVKVYCNELIILNWNVDWAWPGGGIGSSVDATYLEAGSLTAPLAVQAFFTGNPPPPPDPLGPFWTGFVASHEVVGTADGDGGDGGGGVDPPDPPDPGGDGSTKDKAINAVVPYTYTVDRQYDGTPIWFKFTATAGNWVATTMNSPNEDYDTYLALWDSTGILLAAGEDSDAEGGDYRSICYIEDAAPGVYYVALTTNPGFSADGFVFGQGEAILPAGTVVSIYKE